MTSPPTTRLYRQAVGPGHQSLQVPSRLQTQIDGAVGMQLRLLTVGLALVCGRQAQEESQEEPQERLQEVSTGVPGGQGLGGQTLSERHGRWVACPWLRRRPSGGRPGSRTAGWNRGPRQPDAPHLSLCKEAD